MASDLVYDSRDAEVPPMLCEAFILRCSCGYKFPIEPQYLTYPDKCPICGEPRKRCGNNVCSAVKDIPGLEQYCAVHHKIGKDANIRAIMDLIDDKYLSAWESIQCQIDEDKKLPELIHELGLAQTTLYEGMDTIRQALTAPHTTAKDRVYLQRERMRLLKDFYQIHTFHHNLVDAEKYFHARMQAIIDATREAELIKGMALLLFYTSLIYTPKSKEFRSVERMLMLQAPVLATEVTRTFEQIRIEAGKQEDIVDIPPDDVEDLPVQEDFDV